MAVVTASLVAIPLAAFWYMLTTTYFARLSEATDAETAAHFYGKAHARLVDNPPWLYIVHDLNPRAFSKKVQGFVSPQSWFVDLTLVSVD